MKTGLQLIKASALCHFQQVMRQVVRITSTIYSAVKNGVNVQTTPKTEISVKSLELHASSVHTVANYSIGTE